MKSRIGKTAITLVLGLAGFVASGANKSAVAVDIVDDAVQMDQLLKDVVTTSNSLCWELYRYHQQQPGYAEAYKGAKAIWSQAGELRAALVTGPVETAVLAQRADEMNQAFADLQKFVAQWGPGDRSQLATTTGSEPRTVVRPGVGVSIPFVGLQVGGGDVVVEEEAVTPLQRLRVHPNLHGSKRALEREFAALKVALSYLQEDAQITSPATATSPTLAPAGNDPVPQPPTPGTTLDSQPTPIPSKPKADSTPTPK